MTTSDWIAAFAALIAAAAAIYAKGAKDEAHKANQISIYNALRGGRLAVRTAMDEFSRFCCSYVTLQHVGTVNGTRDLVAQIESFQAEVAGYGPLGMPDVERLCDEMVKAGWRMQRVLDRISGGQQTPHDRGYATADDNRDGIADWFGEQRKRLPDLFRPYLAPGATE
jgi:hypothetical protein